MIQSGKLIPLAWPPTPYPLPSTAWLIPNGKWKMEEQKIERKPQFYIIVVESGNRARMFHYFRFTLSFIFAVRERKSGKLQTGGKQREVGGGELCRSTRKQKLKGKAVEHPLGSILSLLLLHATYHSLWLLCCKRPKPSLFLLHIPFWPGGARVWLLAEWWLNCSILSASIWNSPSKKRKSVQTSSPVSLLTIIASQVFSVCTRVWTLKDYLHNFISSTCFSSVTLFFLVAGVLSIILLAVRYPWLLVLYMHVLQRLF